jgi:16S rRNA (adenine1518-N6/adenine1519-N6)-dimethyltransferase
MNSFGKIYQKKSLGQVFLNSDWPVVRMLEVLDDWNIERILEIGPGAGILTKGLLSRGWHVTAVEKDERFAEQLVANVVALEPSLAGTNKLTVRREDILRFDLETWLASSKAPTAIVGNIPYNISSPIVLKALPLLPKLTGVMLMTQLEFAERVAAKPNSKDYGSLSVFTQLRGKVNFEFEVGRDTFRPVPKVDSAVISIQALDALLPEAILKKTEMLTRAAFSQRRKKLRNSIRQFFEEGITAIETGSPVDLERRAETLSPDEFVALAKYVIAD